MSAMLACSGNLAMPHAPASPHAIKTPNTRTHKKNRSSFEACFQTRLRDWRACSATWWVDSGRMVERSEPGKLGGGANGAYPPKTCILSANLAAAQVGL